MIRHISGNHPGIAGWIFEPGGAFALQFNPTWPLQEYVGGAAVWNFMLAGWRWGWWFISIVAKRGRGGCRLLLGGLRLGILGLVLILLNRPVLTLGQARREPSVLAILWMTV